MYTYGGNFCIYSRLNGVLTIYVSVETCNLWQSQWEDKESSRLGMLEALPVWSCHINFSSSSISQHWPMFDFGILLSFSFFLLVDVVFRVTFLKFLYLPSMIQLLRFSSVCTLFILAVTGQVSIMFFFFKGWVKWCFCKIMPVTSRKTRAPEVPESDRIIDLGEPFHSGCAAG